MINKIFKIQVFFNFILLSRFKWYILYYYKMIIEFLKTNLSFAN